MNQNAQEGDTNMPGVLEEELELDRSPENLKSKSHQNMLDAISIKNSIDEIVMKAERSKSLDPTQHIDFERIKQRTANLMSIGDFNGMAISPDTYEYSSKNKNWYGIRESVLKSNNCSKTHTF